MLGFLKGDRAPVRSAEELISEGVAQAGDKELIVLSDFDHTLCDGYITSELVEAAQDVPLVIATGRRASSATAPIRRFWETGLLHPSRPAIVENGGTLAYPGNDEYGLDCVDLAPPEAIAALSDIKDAIEARGLNARPGLHPRITLARTMILLDLFGGGPADFTALAKYVKPLVKHPELRVVDTRNSVTIQGKNVSKSSGFAAALKRLGLVRENVFVVGMGDGPNDEELFAVADFGIGFSDAVRKWVDVDIPEGSVAAPAVLRAIREGYGR